jgi:hypothetical protein
LNIEIAHRGVDFSGRRIAQSLVLLEQNGAAEPGDGGFVGEDFDISVRRLISALKRFGELIECVWPGAP